MCYRPDPQNTSIAGVSSNTRLVLTPGDELAMIALGGRLGAALTPGVVVFLNGDLGMGKTTLARGIIQSLGHSGAVKSPTYTLVEPYELPAFMVYHFDLYRLGDPEELEFMGVLDYFDEHSVCLIEWSQRGKGFLPSADLVINIEREGLGRQVELQAFSALGEGVIESIT